MHRSTVETLGPLHLGIIQTATWAGEPHVRTKLHVKLIYTTRMPTDTTDEQPIVARVS